MDRLIIAHTPLPAHQLLFRSLSGEEKLAGLFEFDVELLSPDNRLDLKALLGQKSRWSCGAIRWRRVISTAISRA